MIACRGGINQQRADRRQLEWKEGMLLAGLWSNTLQQFSKPKTPSIDRTLEALYHVMLLHRL